MKNEAGKLGSVGLDPGAPGGDLAALALYASSGLVFSISYKGVAGHSEALRRISAVSSLYAKGLGVRWRKRERVA